jgi:uncharacterized protein DUF5670
MTYQINGIKRPYLGLVLCSRRYLLLSNHRPDAMCPVEQTTNAMSSTLLAGLQALCTASGSCFAIGPASRWDKAAGQKVHQMLYTIAVVLIILWLLGLVTSYTMGGFVHILLVIALVMILLNLLNGRRVL